MSSVKNYLSLIKFSHTVFAMPFALIGFFLAYFSIHYSMSPGWHLAQYPTGFLGAMGLKLFLIILCMVFARSAAMAFNRYLDRHYDALNPRTAVREIPSGIINEKNALTFTIVNALLFVICTFFINLVCFFLSPVALFIILFYSYTKRFTALCHLVLGLGLSLAPIGAYLAVIGQFNWLPVFFSFAVLFWVSGFDIIYALQDEEFDKKNQLHSIPSMMGKAKALHVSELLHVLAAASVIGAGVLATFGISYWMGTAVFVGMLIYQHSIVKPNDLRRVNIAFMTANGIASVVFAFFVILDLFVHQNTITIALWSK